LLVLGRVAEPRFEGLRHGPAETRVEARLAVPKSERVELLTIRQLGRLAEVVGIDRHGLPSQWLSKLRRGPLRIPFGLSLELLVSDGNAVRPRYCRHVATYDDTRELESADFLGRRGEIPDDVEDGLRSD
jgi:hypothetical protein